MTADRSCGIYTLTAGSEGLWEWGWRVELWIRCLDLDLGERVKVHPGGGGTATEPCLGATGTLCPQLAWRSQSPGLAQRRMRFPSGSPESQLRTAETLRRGREGVATCRCVL